MKRLWKEYIESWRFTIEFAKRSGSGYSGKDWIKGVGLVTIHCLSVGVVWISLLHYFTGP